MTHRLHRIVATGALLAAAALAVHASAPVFWEVSTRADFLKGEVDNLSLDSDGRLALGPATETVFDSSAPFLWTLLAGPAGSVYAASGNDGKVFRIGRDGKATTLFDAAEMEVHALAPAPGGGLFAASSPDGRIYRIDASGSATPFFDPQDKYIWSLAVDSAGFHAGTGEDVIYKVARRQASRSMQRRRPTSWRSQSTPRATSWPEPTPPGASSASARTERPRCCSIRS
jgi:hypothetical protein